MGKGENTGNQHFLPFPVFSTLLKREIIILAMINLSSVHVFNLVTSEILSLGKYMYMTFFMLILNILQYFFFFSNSPQVVNVVQV